MRTISPSSASDYRGDALQPEILRGEVVDPRVADVEFVARWLDYAFELPGGFRFGLGGIVGLIPGIGDIIEALISLYIVGRAVQLGIPRVTVARMVVNVGIESVAGAVPFAGAMFDTVFKANRRNYRLLLSHFHGPRRKASSDWWFLAITAVLLLAGIAIPVILMIELIKHL